MNWQGPFLVGAWVVWLLGVLAFVESARQHGVANDFSFAWQWAIIIVAVLLWPVVALAMIVDVLVGHYNGKGDP